MTPPTPILFRRADLLRRRAELFGVSKGRVALLAGGAGAGLALTLWFKKHLEHTEDVTQVWPLAATGLLVVPGVLALMVILAARDLRRQRVLCPCCAKEVLFDLTLATHRCGWCGEPIVSEPPPLATAAGDASLLPTRAEFAQKVRLAGREIGFAGFGTLVALGAGFPILFGLGNWLDRQGGGAPAPTAFGVLFLVFLGLAGVPLAWGLRRAANRYQLRCGSCRKSLLIERRANLAVATGRCPVCGAAVLREEPGLSTAFHSQATG